MSRVRPLRRRAESLQPVCFAGISPEPVPCCTVHLARSPALLAAVKAAVKGIANATPLFDTEQHTRDLERGYACMWEVYNSCGRVPPPAWEPHEGAAPEWRKHIVVGTAAARDMMSK